MSAGYALTFIVGGGLGFLSCFFLIPQNAIMHQARNLLQQVIWEMYQRNQLSQVEYIMLVDELGRITKNEASR